MRDVDQAFAGSLPLKTDLRAKTALAAEIAGIHPQKLNESVAAGFYPCAPETIAGLARAFDVDDILVLMVFRHLLDEGMLPRAAGPLVCQLRALLSQHPDANNVVWIKTSFGPEGWYLSTDFDSSEDFFQGGNVVSHREWRLGMMRALIVHKLTEATKVVG